jgi:hypothetical protein
VKEVLDFRPFNRCLPPALKLLFEVDGGSPDRWILLIETPAQSLSDEENQTGQARVFRQAYFKRAPQQSRYVEGRVHPPKFVESICVDPGTGSVSIPSE